MGLFIKLTSDICHENGRVVHFSLVQFAQFSSVQDDYAFTEKSPYALYPVSWKFAQCCL